MAIDGTFLKSIYNGKLLCAVAYDSNMKQYLLAYGLVSEETTENWSWFLRHLHEYVFKDRRGVCLISDRHRGITAAMNDPINGWTAPYRVHKFCLFHVRSNFASAHPGSEVKVLCWAAGIAHYQRKFEDTMTRIKEIFPPTEAWLCDIPPEMWTLSYDGDYRHGKATTNMAVYNVKMARFMPVTAMVEYIFYRTVKMFNERRTKATVDISNGNVYCVESRKQFEVIEKKGNNSQCNVRMYNRQVGVYDVTTAQYRSRKCRKGGNLQVVKLMET